jgi:hypothetical protein
MNNMKIIKLLVSISVLIFILNSCEKEPVENPCECGQKPVSANFTITETRGWPDWLIADFEPYDTDTIMFGSAVFTALEEDATYTWLIGIETLQDKVVERSGFPEGQAVPITLIIEKTPDNECFPNDDGRDTLTRYLYKAESRCESLIQGEYHGALVSNPQDTFTVLIDNCPPYPQIPGFSNWSLYIKNLERDCEFICEESIVSHRQIVFFSGADQCERPRGQIKLSDNDSDLTIKYRNSPENIEYTFKGTKK